MLEEAVLGACPGKGPHAGLSDCGSGTARHGAPPRTTRTSRSGSPKCEQVGLGLPSREQFWGSSLGTRLCSCEWNLSIIVSVVKSSGGAPAGPVLHPSTPMGTPTESWISPLAVQPGGISGRYGSNETIFSAPMTFYPPFFFF